MNSRNSKAGWLIGAIVVVAVLIALVLHGRAGADKPMQRQAATPVAVAAVALADVPVYIDALGTVTPTRTVTVATQIDGILDEVNFSEGQHVKRGQLIARIDDRALRAQLEQAQGVLQHDQATLTNAEHDLQRYRVLIKAGSITQQLLDTQVATVAEDQGTVQADRGNVANLAVQVSYCQITSPVDGVVGLRLIDPGNYVSTTSTTGIAVITAMDPATVVFAVPEDDLGQIRQAMAAGPVAVGAFDREDVHQLASGSLLALDNQVDTSTGTVRVKASFPQADQVLFPNQFVNAHLKAATLSQVPVVPTRAIQHGSDGDFLFVLAGHKVSLRQVKVGPSQGDNSAILGNGVHPGEKVVTDGADKLDDGSPVRVAAA
ncbi:MAG: efflux RND transporter periplasmic adaptor subunit [Dyella sp.]